VLKPLLNFNLLIASKIAEDSGETGKKNYVNFKKVVWHEAFRKLLETIATYSKTGYWFDCADAVKQWLFPLILILSADYEEQYVPLHQINKGPMLTISHIRSIMALISGIGSNYPCPICFVHKDELINLEKDHPLRTTESMRDALFEAQVAPTVAEGEKILKAYGLRGIPVCASLNYSIRQK
jgi:Plavaka transposase